MREVIYSKHIYTEDAVVDGYVIIEDGKFSMITDHYDGDEEVKAYPENMILPGIIDIHSHGYHSWSAKTIDKEEIKGLSAILPSIGVTATLATTTAWQAEEFHMLEEISTAIKEGCEGAKILGIHMEGPFYNPIRHNATPEKEVQLPSVEKTLAYIKAAQGTLKYMTIAPEMPHAHEVMDVLCANGIIVGAGHTMASYQDFVAAKQHGMKTSIHTGNAMQQMDRRDVGLLGGALLDPDIYCEIICDLFHLSKEMLELMFRIKNDSRRFLMISDSDILSGVPAGTYEAFGKHVHVHEDGRILLEDGTINGSSKYVLYGMANLVKKLQVPLQDVILMNALNPATLLGMQDTMGSIKQGKQADFIIVDSAFEIQATYVDGRCVYQKGDSLRYNENFGNICRRLS